MEKIISYDKNLQIEMCKFDGFSAPFIKHFHDYYVIGSILDGKRKLTCKNKNYIIKKGNIFLFNPNDSHSCTQFGNNTLSYFSLNIKKEVMLDLSLKIKEKKELPYFSKNVIFDNEINFYLSLLQKSSNKEIFLILLKLLINRHGTFKKTNKQSLIIKQAENFIKQNYNKRIYLEDICSYCNLSKSSLLRIFTKEKRITPYNYLENIRIQKAKELLENGLTVIEAANRSGFFDQSHFTNYFNKFFGLTPYVYQKFILKEKE